VGCDEDMSILQALQMFTAAWKILSITTVSDWWHKAGILSVRDKIMEESLIDDHFKDSWQQICQKINVPVEVMMEDFISVAVIQEATDDIVNSIIEGKGRNSDKKNM
jgi:hypothetical protein